MDIPWTPRTKKRAAAKPQPGTDFDLLRAVIIRALKPFTEARIAVADALADHDKQQQAQLQQNQ